MLGRLSGTVRDANTNNPIHGAIVNIYDRTTDTQITDISGVYYSNYMAGGTYLISVQKEGYLPSPALTAQIVDNQTSIFDIYLEIAAITTVFPRSAYPFFLVCSNVQNIRETRYLAIRLNNPVSSVKSICIDRLFCSYTRGNVQSDYITISIFKDSSLVTGTTTLPIYNLDFGSTTGSVCGSAADYRLTANNPIQTLGALITADIQLVSLTMASYSYTGNLEIPPGHSIVFQIYNNNAGDSFNASMTVDWWES